MIDWCLPIDSLRSDTLLVLIFVVNIQIPTKYRFKCLLHSLDMWIFNERFQYRSSKIDDNKSKVSISVTFTCESSFDWTQHFKCIQISIVIAFEAFAIWHWTYNKITFLIFLSHGNENKNRKIVKQKIKSWLRY